MVVVVGAGVVLVVGARVVLVVGARVVVVVPGTPFAMVVADDEQVSSLVLQSPR